MMRQARCLTNASSRPSRSAPFVSSSRKGSSVTSSSIGPTRDRADLSSLRPARSTNNPPRNRTSLSRAALPLRLGRGRSSTSSAAFSPLHDSIITFSEAVSLTAEEERVKRDVVEGLRQSTWKAFPELKKKAQVQVFGSLAAGMSAWHSDVDLVITGCFSPDRVTGGYDQGDRGRVTAKLRKLADTIRKMRRVEVANIQVISKARVPIIKLRTENSVSVDISISNDSGVQAALYMATLVRAYPPLRPLALVLKTFLKSEGLNDVASGGLSSYALVCMVAAHLQEELKSGHDIFDLGEALYSFLLRFGAEFNLKYDAVSVRSGGIVPKSTLQLLPGLGGRQAPGPLEQSYERLCVDCPLSGRDVSSGTYRISEVREALSSAAGRLEALAASHTARDPSANLLSALFDVERALSRQTGGGNNPYFTVIGGNERELLVRPSCSTPPSMEQGRPEARGPEVDTHLLADLYEQDDALLDEGEEEGDLLAAQEEALLCFDADVLLASQTARSRPAQAARRGKRR